MTDDARLPLDLHLLSSEAALPDGPRVKSLADAAAVVTSLGPDRVEVHVSLPGLSLAEQRFVVDQVIRKTTALVSIGSADLFVDEHVTGDAALTIGLDLYNRTDGKARIPERSELDARLRVVGDLEQGFRGWVDQDPSERTSLAIVRDVVAFGNEHDTVRTEVFEEDHLRELGMNLLLAVGQGSETSPSRLVVARYSPGGKSESPLMLLGKGVTFDTGGINVKPYDAFVPMMKNDMAGAALAFHLFRGLVESGHPEPVVLVLPTCENAIGARSMRPGALVKGHRGLTVRIDHTDAEGRLILADALSYASSEYEPHQVLCFATLTTAALIAYGPYATPVHFADADFEARLRRASEATGEDLHFFPRRIWHFEANRDREGDLRNTARLPGNASRGAGSRNAAHFLCHFTDSPLCHFDIFASTWNWAGDAPGAGYGATGAPLRTVLAALGDRS